MPLEQPTRVFASFMRPWILLALRVRPAHGYELKRRLDELGLAPDAGGLYRCLQRLEDDGLVRSDSRSAAGRGPMRRVYRATAKGTRQIHKDAEAFRVLGDALDEYFREYETVQAKLERRRAKAPQS